MWFVALAGLSGLVWGVGDFAGGKATQRASALSVAWLSKLVGLPLLVIYLIALGTPLPTASLGWGAAAGVIGMLGIMFFYRALAGGAMAVVAPVTAVTSAVIPVVAGLLLGERPGLVRLLGVGCALLAIALVSLAPAHPDHPSTVTGGLIGLALTSGASFGLFFVFLSLAGDAAAVDPGLWPIAASQVSALLLGTVLLAVLRPGRWPRQASRRWVVMAGAFDMSANALFLLASRSGDLSLVAPLAALYPVTTVILALVVDSERIRPVQVAGLVLALAALLLVSR